MRLSSSTNHLFIDVYSTGKFGGYLQANPRIDWFDAEAKRKELVELEFAPFLKADERNGKNVYGASTYYFSLTLLLLL